MRPSNGMIHRYMMGVIHDFRDDHGKVKFVNLADDAAGNYQDYDSDGNIPARYLAIAKRLADRMNGTVVRYRRIDENILCEVA